jgi:hypothetical protein
MNMNQGMSNDNNIHNRIRQQEQQLTNHATRTVFATDQQNMTARYHPWKREELHVRQLDVDGTRVMDVECGGAG